jgi:ABC-type uncharacterized transport system involved in gliding motility auxiliary subunit
MKLSHKVKSTLIAAGIAGASLGSIAAVHAITGGDDTMTKDTQSQPSTSPAPSPAASPVASTTPAADAPAASPSPAASVAPSPAVKPSPTPSAAEAAKAAAIARQREAFRASTVQQAQGVSVTGGPLPSNDPGAHATAQTGDTVQVIN